MSLDELFIGGILRPGPTISAVDEIVVHDGHPTSLEDVVRVLGGNQQRDRLCSELQGLVRWLEAGLGASAWCMWLRGEFASTLRPHPTTLDVVLLAGDLHDAIVAWPLRILASRPHQLDLDYTLDITYLPGSDRRTFDHDQERRRSGRRCQNDDGEQLVTGWLELRGGGT